MGNKDSKRVFNKYLKACLLLVLFNTCLEIRSVTAEDPSCKVAERALAIAEKLRGLKAKESVPCTLETKDTVLKFLKDSVQKKIPAAKLEAEQTIYRTLGFIPEDFSYVDALLKMYADQVGGYYDPDSKRYVMAAWLPSALQPTIAVHELTHAIQDQNFNLKNLMADDRYTSDELLAHSALAEGDATAVMNDFQLGEGAVSKLQNVDALILQTVLGSYLTQGLANAPDGIKNMMIFPYTSGLRFVHFFLKKGGFSAVNAVFKSPPKSTAEILHPELYPLSRPAIPGSGADAEYTDSLGEFFISTWLAPKARNKAVAIAAASGLLNDVISIEKSGDISWYTLWNKESDAREFREAVQSVLPLSSRKCSVLSELGTHIVKLRCAKN